MSKAKMLRACQTVKKSNSEESQNVGGFHNSEKVKMVRKEQIVRTAKTVRKSISEKSK